MVIIITINYEINTNYFLDQELISYRYLFCCACSSSCWDNALQKKPTAPSLQLVLG